MSLPAPQQRVLEAMENALQASEPRLASMFAMFDRLNNGEPVCAESLRSRSRRAARAGTPVYALVVIPLMFAMIIGVLIGGTAHGAATCGSLRRATGLSEVGQPTCTLATRSVFGQAAATGVASPAPGAARKSCTAGPVRQGAFPQLVAAGVTTPHPSVTC